MDGSFNKLNIENSSAREYDDNVTQENLGQLLIDYSELEVMLTNSLGILQFEISGIKITLLYIRNNILLAFSAKFLLDFSFDTNNQNSYCSDVNSYIDNILKDIYSLEEAYNIPKCIDDVEVFGIISILIVITIFNIY